MCSPWRSVSSPTLTTAVSSPAATTSTMPRSSRAAPTPPASAVITGGAASSRRSRVASAQATRRRAPAVRRPSPSRRPCRCGRPPGMCKAHDVPPERPATAVDDRLSVGFDATPLLGRPTGVGVFCAGALAGLAGTGRRGGVRLRRELAPPEGHRRLVPRGVRIRQRPMPARPLHAAWAHGSRAAARVVRRPTPTSSTARTSWSRPPARRPGW